MKKKTEKKLTLKEKFSEEECRKRMVKKKLACLKRVMEMKHSWDSIIL